MTQPPELFIVGSGRSGTTIVLHALGTAVPGCAALPRLAGRLPAATVPAVRLARAGLGPWGWRQPSSEATAVFAEAGLTQERQIELGGRSMRRDDVPPALLARLSRRVEQIRRHSGADTVVLKNTASCGRIPLLHEVFPTARFLEVTRSPSAVIASLLAVDFWPTMTLWWDGRTTQQYAEDEHLSQERVAARHWAFQARRAHEDLAALTDEPLLTLDYAAFTRDPAGQLARLQPFGFGPPDREALARLGVRPVPEHRTIPAAVREAIDEECRDTMALLGVEP